MALALLALVVLARLWFSKSYAEAAGRFAIACHINV